LPEEKPSLADTLHQRQMALSRWDNEGGAGPSGLQQDSIAGDAPRAVPELTNAELVQLRVRVIALENLVIALLAAGTDRQLDLAREMASNISPRPDFTQHPLTIHAASHMIDLLERAGHFRVPPASATPYKHTQCSTKTYFPPRCAGNTLRSPVYGV
jgi:hypothetical protein